MPNKPTGFLCGPKLYRYDGWFFEVHSYCGPWPLQTDGEQCWIANRCFWRMYKKFQALTDKGKSSYRVGGGCQEF